MRALLLLGLLAAAPVVAQPAPPAAPPAPAEDCGCGVPTSPRGPR
ncbi:hypothetical protein [Falsiroseomonas sp. CW058]